MMNTHKQLKEIFDKYGWYNNYEIETEKGLYSCRLTGEEDLEDLESDILVEMLEDNMPFSFPAKNIVAVRPLGKAVR